MQQNHPQNSIPNPIHIYSAGNTFPHQAQAYSTIPPPRSADVEQQEPISLYLYAQPPPLYNPANQQIGEGNRATVVYQPESIVPVAVVPPTHQEELNNQAVVPTVQPEFCSICQLSCNSKIVYDQHITGKKHLRKLALSGLPPPTPPVREQVMELSNSQIARMKRKAAAVEDMESKRMKVVQAGASADQVIVCTPCNVICNTRIVYDSHVKGMKHLRAMHRQ